MVSNCLSKAAVHIVCATTQNCSMASKYSKYTSPVAKPPFIQINFCRNAQLIIKSK